MGRKSMSEESSFIPPYCPNPKCLHHKGFLTGTSFRAWRRKGFERRKNSVPVLRFECFYCKKNFCRRNFSINYRLKKTGHLNARIFFGVLHNRSNRSLSRELRVSECLVRTRIVRLANTALIHHASFVEDLKILEPVSYDGLEAFAKSQYEPNNINQAVGQESLFCYLFNFAPMNRKGRISNRQRRKLLCIEGEEGRFNPRAIREASAEIFSDLVGMKDPRLDRLHLCTDEHFHYRRAIQNDLPREISSQIFHQSVSSKATRNYKNILFSVNHLDLLIRRKVAAFTRETICFSKKHSSMLQKYVLYMSYKNYMKPRFTKRHKKDPSSNTHSPAMKLGLCQRLLKFQDIFASPIPPSHVGNFPRAWTALLKDEVLFKRELKYCR